MHTQNYYSHSLNQIYEKETNHSRGPQVKGN